MVIVVPVLRVVRTLDSEALRRRVEELRVRAEDGDEEAEEILEYMEEILRLGDEEGEVEYVEEVEVAYDPSTHRRLFSHSIVELLAALALGEAESISRLARMLGRDVGNVYRDLKWLEKQGFVELRRSGRRVKPILLVSEYTLRLQS